MSVATSDPRVPPCCTSFPQRNRGVSSVRSSVSYRLGRFTRDIFPMSAVFRWKNAGCVALVLLLLASGWGASIDSPPSGPAIYNTEHWIPLSHTNDPTYTMGALKPLPPVSESWKDPTSLIFVGIIHYRDRRCSTTLANLFANAKNPERIRVGIVEQIQTEEDSYTCVEQYCRLKHATLARGCPFIDQIKIIQLTHNLARGPNTARYMQDSLRANEEFCLQVDAHSDFAPQWDSLLTEMWGSVANEYAVLSSVPVDTAVLKQGNLNGQHQMVPHLCQAKFDERGQVVNLPPTLASSLPRPILSPLYDAGNAFGKCHAWDKVPPDPNLQMTFEADEFPIYARLWTRGYDVYTPNKIAVAHDYYDTMPGVAQNLAQGDKIMEWATRKPGLAQFNRYLYDRSIERVASLLGAFDAPKDASALATLTRYGLGTKRSLEDLIEFTGIDTRKRTVFGDRCTELKWVPYRPDPDPYVDSGDVWGAAPETLPAGGRNNPVTPATGRVTIFPEDAYRNAYVDAQSYSTSTFDAAVRAASAGGTGGAIPIGARAGVKAGMEVVAADAKYLRAQAEKYAGNAKIKLQQDMQELESLVQHRGKELWWLFQPLDSALESVMNRLDAEFGVGMGSKAMKVILLLIPLAVLLVYLAVRALTPSASVEEDVQLVVSMGQQLFQSPPASARKHTTMGKQH